MVKATMSSLIHLFSLLLECLMVEICQIEYLF